MDEVAATTAPEVTAEAAVETTEAAAPTEEVVAEATTETTEVAA